jgi:hypothetical protein
MQLIGIKKGNKLSRLFPSVTFRPQFSNSFMDDLKKLASINIQL